MTLRRFPHDLFSGTRFAVCGLGRNGNAVIKALLRMGAHVHAWDDSLSSDVDNIRQQRKTLCRETTDPDAFTLAPFETLTGCDGLILSPGIPHFLPRPHPSAELARKADIPILSDAELLFQAVRRSGSQARFVSITGTNGKSTTTALVAHLLSQAGLPVVAGGNLGPAALALPLLPDDGIYVLEMSSYMLERLRTYKADAACLLNLTPDHLDRHGDMTGYRAAKEHVFDRMTSDDLAVVSVNDIECRDIAKSLEKRGMNVTRLSTNDIRGEGASTRVDEGSSALPGTHNLQNALAARAIVKHLGLDDAQIENGIRCFQGLAHRQQRVGSLEGVRFVNDSKATNVEAATKALICYERVIWIAGGQAKSGGIDALVPLFPRIKRAFLIGQDGKKLCDQLRHYGVAAEYVETLERAIHDAFDAARALGVNTVLLSPACASFDQFTDFEARGNAFINLVKTLSPHLTSPMEG